MITVKNLTKSYTTGDTELVVLKNLSLEIPRGQFVAITGRSGSGKSTLLYQLGLLDRPNSGHITIDSIDILKLENNDRTKFRLKELGYVFQDYALVPELNTLENVLVPLLMQGIDPKQARDRAEKALIKIGLSDKMENLPSQLSGGQQQRVSIARAIGHNPKIIFADEPTANLDKETSKIVLNAFVELNKQGQTIIMVTHEPEFAVLAHRTITLDDGVIVSDNMNNNIGELA
jgi:putative ABC transport system ATP-binding protein